MAACPKSQAPTDDRGKYDVKVRSKVINTTEEVDGGRETMTEETWKIVEDFPEYLVSNFWPV